MKGYTNATVTQTLTLTKTIFKVAGSLALAASEIGGVIQITKNGKTIATIVVTGFDTFIVSGAINGSLRKYESPDIVVEAFANLLADAI